MMQGNEPQIIRRDNAYSVKKQFGDIYDCIVTNVLNDGRIYVYVPDLGSDLGPILPLSTDITNKYSVNDTVVGTFMSSAMTSFVIFGSSKARKRSSILIFSTEQERTDSLGAIPSSSFFTYVIETGYLQLWNGTAWTQFIGPTGPAGATGATGATGAPGEWSSAQTVLSISTGELNSTHAGKLLYNSGVCTLTVTSSSGFSIGQRVDLARLDTGTFTVAQGSGAILNGTPAYTLRARYSAASIICTASNTYLLVGDLG